MDKTRNVSSGRMAGFYKWEVLALLWMAYLLNQADRQVFNTVLPQIRDSLSLTDVSIGWIATIFNLFFALSVPLGGWAGDRLSRKWVTTCSILFWSVATMLTGFAGGFISLVLFRSIATGGGEAVFSPSCMALLAQYHTDTRARALSIHQTAYYIGIILSGFLAGLIADKMGWQWSFCIFGSVGIIWGIVMIFRLKDKPAETAPAALAPAEAQPAAAKPGFLDGFKFMFKTPTAIMLIIGFSGLIFVLNGYLTWMPTYLHESFDMTLAQAGFNATFYTHIFAFVGVLLAGSISDRIGAKNPRWRMALQGIGLLFAVPFLFMMGSPRILWVVYLGCAGFGFARAFFDANTYTVLYDVIPPRLHASASSVMIMIGFGVGSLAPVVLAAIKTSRGLAFGFSCLAVIWLVCGALMLLVSRLHYQKDYDKMRKNL
jgi:MFS family permease